MQDFPDFMKHPADRIGSAQQNTHGVEGYVYDGKGGGQMAFWTCRDQRDSAEHTHDFDKYMVCLSGQYTAYLNGREVVLNPGDELYIPAGTRQGAHIAPGTRTIHAFGGRRIVR